ncbi:MAG: adenylate/guanylate cyclase domain-containing protein [Bacteroidota bacterium]
MAKSKRRQSWVYLALGIGVFLISVGVSQFRIMKELDLRLMDRLFEWRGPLVPEDSPIVLVAISEQADSEIREKYPWPTSIYARLIHNLNRAGARVIVFDVLFVSPDDYDAENDTRFSDAMQAHGNVVLAGDFQKETMGQQDIEVPVFPIDELRKGSGNPVGLVGTSPSIDGFIREYTLGRIHNDSSYYTLGLEALRLYSGMTTRERTRLTEEQDEDQFAWGDYIIRRSNLNSFIINYYGPEGVFPTYSLERVIDDSTYSTVFEQELGPINDFEDPEHGLLAQGVFKDKIVLIGSTMPALQDFHATPFASADIPRPGFEVHAHAMQTVLDQQYLSKVSPVLVLLQMLFLVVFMLLVNIRFGVVAGYVTGILSIVLAIGGAYALFVSSSIILFVAGPIVSVVISQVGFVGLEYLQEQREKRRIEGMFSSYVSPKLVQQMIESGEEPKLGGEEQEITAFFSDIESFSTFSEILEPNQLVALINEYLDAMTSILSDHGGTLDKYIGDAIVAFFGAPVVFPDHAQKACISSVLMQKKMGELRKKWSQDGWPELVSSMKNRIGMNSGLMVTGNMGSTQRFNYTMMGDNVNLAARCESGAKQYGVYTMVTEATKTQALNYGDDCVFRYLDKTIVKGRTIPVKLYELVDLRSEVRSDTLECIEQFEEGLAAYFNQEWERAVGLFSESARLEPHQTSNPSNVFLTRCQTMKQNPPNEEWDGVFRMKEK